MSILKPIEMKQTPSAVHVQAHRGSDCQLDPYTFAMVGQNAMQVETQSLNEI